MSFLKVGQKVLKAFGESHCLNLSEVPIKPVKALFEFKNPHILEVLPDHLCTPASVEKLKMLDGKPIGGVVKFLDKFGQSEDDFVTAINKFFKNKLPKGFSESEFQVLYKKAFPNIKVPIGANEDAFIYLNRLSRETGSQFDAHGVAKVSVTDQLKQLNELLTKGIERNRNFCTAPLVSKVPGVQLGTAGGHAYRDGSFIIVSGKNKTLTEQGIEHVIVNDAYYNIVDDLTKKFPDVKFVKADVAAEYFENLAKT